MSLALRLYRLDAQSLWLDEGSSWQMVGQGWGALLLDLFSPAAAYPLYHLLLKGWVALAGDSEWALRLPSALAGAGAVAATYAAALEMRRLEVDDAGDADRSRGSHLQSPYPLVAALLLATSPFAIWYGQEAKVYSLLLLLAGLLLWGFLRALRLGARRAWLLFAGLALAGVFVHRLAFLLVLAALVAWLVTTDGMRRAPGERRGSGARRLLFAVLVAGLSAAVVWAMARGLGSDRAATGAYIPADPARALWLTFSRFSVDRWPGDAPLWWLLPWAAMAVWGLFSIADCRLQIADWRQRIADYPLSRRALLCFLLVPLVLFLAQLVFTRLYEARYLIVIYPAWVLLLAYPSRRLAPFQDTSGGVTRESLERDIPAQPSPGPKAVVYGLLLAGALATSAAALTQPRFGLFSGDPVKEQYREALGELARRLHPDDLVVLHPAYLRPLYDYYLRRLSADPPPEPISFGDFKQGQQDFGKREWEVQQRAAFAGYLRSFLVIAPDHARTVDPPPLPQDEYGWVGLHYLYSRDQRTWPCGIWRRAGVHLLCQEAPEAYTTGVAPQPATPVGRLFGDNLELMGYTLKATTPAGPGTYRAGGNLPISLFWNVRRQPAADYSVFLHLCRDCDIPPAASDDGPPLSGYLPTSVWLPGKPARDDRAIPLPRDLPPGRYTLLLGLYRPGDPWARARLPVGGPGVLDGNRLVLGTVEVVRAADGPATAARPCP